MIEFDMEVSGEDAVKEGLDEFAESTRGTANDALVEMGEDIKDEIESTAPVDTGEYQESWKLIEVKENMIVLVNTADHAKYVVFPNTKMKGVASADDPARGILHNVRGIVKDNIQEHRAGFITKLKNKLF